MPLHLITALARAVFSALHLAFFKGLAVAGGCILALAMDHSIMTQGKHKIGLPELLLVSLCVIIAF